MASLHSWREILDPPPLLGHIPPCSSAHTLAARRMRPGARPAADSELTLACRASTITCEGEAGAQQGGGGFGADPGLQSLDDHL